MDNWKSYHIFYHDGLLQERLICECIYPLMKELKDGGSISKWFFIRYWEGGPHIRLRFLPIKDVENQVVSRISTFLEENKAQITISREEYYKNQKFDGKPLDVSTLPWFENNSIVPVDYERELERYGGENTIPYCESIFMVTSDYAARIIDATKDSMSKRISISIDLIMVFLNQMDINIIPFFYYYGKLWTEYFADERSVNAIKTVNAKARINRLIVQGEKGEIIKNWERDLKPYVDAIKDIWKDDDTKLYSLAISLVHMFNNRLGIVPDLERQIAIQIAREGEAYEYTMENRA
ncbi:MAG: thiopeptide-type bacteriocin biosynthesis protein [Pseudobutyrivibrio sp.]|nr:thiopeptide-type bacteriocin biosynthesis protein [Pseudobutyrivibrio sp.]